ncbi:centromere protein O isoform X2 [Girardinichthys multiradiatus]|uniref:centromere protein O isoform X2 n=1 Tax=Girardinichthys multiradiatus TaxID=208333 RepID=UPI001FAE094E|nr:centromere protein O isoform X2 [Girardinichthys multiradiatus]
MEGVSTRGVLSHLSLLEDQASSRGSRVLQQPCRVKELKAKVEALTSQRDQLKAEIQTHKNLQKLRPSVDKRRVAGEEEDMDVDSESSELLRLMARHSELSDLLHAHHLIGGYDVIKTRQGKGMCFSLATAYEGIYLDTYNLEIDLKPKEQHKSVEVMESNLLCSILVLMFTVPKEKTHMLCTLEYTNHTRCLPTRVHLESEDKRLPDAPQWKKNCSLLTEVPVHRALTAIRKSRDIV